MSSEAAAWAGRAEALGAVISLDKIFAADTGLTANMPQRGGFQAGMIGHGQWRASAIGVLSDHRNMFAFADDFKAQFPQGGNHPGFGCIYGEFGHGLDGSLGDESIQGRIF